MENPPAEKRPVPLHGMFTAVPPRYDLINRIITMGLDRHWRKLAAETCLEDSAKQILDLGCGTGDLTTTIARLASRDVHITGLDYSAPMLDLARQKALAAQVQNKVTFLEGDATRMPFADASFDCVGISFAFRNLTYKNPLCQPHLNEVRRVLKPGGRYVIVESSQPNNAFIRDCFHLYLRAFVKPAGQFLSKNRGAYNYLASSAADYYSPEEVRKLLLDAGFLDVKYRPLFFGAAGIHVAKR